MPHYKNGREIKAGDRVVCKHSYGGNIVAGTIVQIYPNTQTCNVQIVPDGSPRIAATASDCLHEDDVEIVVKDEISA